MWIVSAILTARGDGKGVIGSKSSFKDKGVGEAFLVARVIRFRQLGAKFDEF